MTQLDSEQVIRYAKELAEDVKKLGRDDSAKFHGLQSRAIDFLVRVGGSRNAFANQLSSLTGGEYGQNILQSVMEEFVVHVEAGLVGGISPKRQAELDVVSDILEQANVLLESPNVHPAAPAVLIGATLEEFVRTWTEEKDLSLGNKKPGLDSYAKLLRAADLITKQDIKDITSWSGIRNHAAHGEWEELKDKARVSLMLEGVNLFMRRYTP